MNKLSVYNRKWQRLLAQIKQKSMVNDEFEEKAFEKIEAAEQEVKESYQKIEQRIKKDDMEREMSRMQLSF